MGLRLQQRIKAWVGPLPRSGKKMASEVCIGAWVRCCLDMYPLGPYILRYTTRPRHSFVPGQVSLAHTETELSEADNCKDNWFVANVYASLCAGACSTMATNPIWVIKTRLMSQSSLRSNIHHTKAPWHYRNTWDAARKMYHQEGLLSFYSGLTPALLGLAHVAVQFPLYELFKERFTGISRGANESETDRSHYFNSLAAAVFLSKICASTATYPHEVVRTRLQTQQRPSISSSTQNVSAPPPFTMNRPRGTWETCRVIYVEEGWRGFYAGLGTNLLRTIPSAMTTILTFEYLKKTLLHLQQDHVDENRTDREQPII